MATTDPSGSVTQPSSPEGAGRPPAAAHELVTGLNICVLAAEMSLDSTLPSGNSQRKVAAPPVPGLRGAATHVPGAFVGVGAGDGLPVGVGDGLPVGLGEGDVGDGLGDAPLQAVPFRLNAIGTAL